MVELHQLSLQHRTITSSMAPLTQLAVLLCLIPQGHTGSLKDRIIGGREAAPHSKPWMAYITYNNQAGERLVCGGFLVSRDFVMTAAHCAGRNTQVSLGLHSLDDKSAKNTFPVLVSNRHANYDSATHDSDIMLLKLKAKVHLNDAIQPIALPKKNKRVASGTVCNVAGWGQMGHGRVPRVLMEVNVTVVNNQRCQESIPVELSDAMMCAGQPGSNGDAAKVRDSNHS
ncbi:hypothetical protein FKM82_020371 [Ascaphus truei]